MSAADNVFKWSYSLNLRPMSIPPELIPQRCSLHHRTAIEAVTRHNWHRRAAIGAGGASRRHVSSGMDVTADVPLPSVTGNRRTSDAQTFQIHKEMTGR